MAGYITPAGLRTLLSRDSADATGTAGELSDTLLQDAIDTASALIDARLANRYQVPFPAPTPALVVQLTKAIAAFHADSLHRQSIDISEGDPVRLRHQWALDTLASVANGTLDLPDTLSTSATPDGSTAVNAYTGVMFLPDDFGLTFPNWGPGTILDDGKW